MQPKGLDLLHPIWAMIYSNEELLINDDYFNPIDKGLGLTEEEVEVTYTRYINEEKSPKKPNDKTITEAAQDKLTPGVKFKYFQKT